MRRGTADAAAIRSRRRPNLLRALATRELDFGLAGNSLVYTGPNFWQCGLCFE